MTARRFRLAQVAFACAAVLAGGSPSPAGAQTPSAPTTPTNIAITGGAAGETRRLPAGQAEFGIRIPLKPNAENIVMISASDDQGQKVSQNVSITQLTLGDIVRAQVTAQRLTTQEVKALVADGTIDIKDPANYNVSIFIIVLTVGGQPVQVRVPVVRPKEEPLAFAPPISIGCSQSGQIQTTERSIAIPCGGSGGESKIPDMQMIPFEMEVPDAQIEARVPGVIIIEGRIKTLKEFFRVNLLLMNVSGVFNLEQITARLELPEGALTHVAPTSGTIAIPDIAAGQENKGDFIIRGDRIGTHTVTAHFGAMLTSPFLPEPVPIAGSASTDLEVKGPPKMDVTVSHPNFVRAGEIYDLTVTIRNTDEELDALFTTFEIDVGVDAELVDETTGLPMDGPAIEELGDILRGQSVTRTFKVLPKATGPIASCTAAATENLKLSMVFTNAGAGRNPGCAIGTLPSQMASPDGKPTVVVVPTHNTTGVTVEPAIAALFSAPMITQTITSGFNGATFRLINPEGGVIGGQLTFGDIFGGTAAVFRPTSPLEYDTEYTVVVEQSIFNEDGIALASGLTARFRTESETAAPDFEPPQGIIVIDPPVNPDAITKGALVPVTVDSFDNVAVTRVDLLLGSNVIDTKRPNSPVRFMVDTAGLAQGSEQLLTARLYDAAGNMAVLNATLRIAPDATAPTVSVAGAATVVRGRVLSVVADAADDGRVDRVQVFVDSANEPSQTLLVGPYAFSVQTGALAPGAHMLRVVAIDGTGNVSSANHPFTVTDDATPPTVLVTSPAAGAEVRAGTTVSVVVAAVDDIGVGTVEIFVDNDTTPRSTGIAGFNLATTGMALGAHRIRAVARDLAGNQAAAESTFVLFEPPVDTTPPAAPLAAKIQVGVPANGIVTITASAGAVEAAARVEIQNTASLASAQTTASAAGAFTSGIEGSGGQMVTIVAIDASGNRSGATLLEIPRPAALTAIAVSPTSVTLNRSTTSRQLTVTGTFSDGTQRALASGDLTFQSLDRTIADVGPTGVVVPGTNGGTTVRVSAPGVASVDVPVTVAMPTIASVAVTPNPVTLRDIGATQRLAVTATYSDGVSQPFTGQVTFAANTPSVAGVDSSGLITGVADGQAIVSVAPAGFPVVNVTVNVERKVLTSITASPASITLIGPGQAQAIAVTGRYSDGTSAALAAGITYLSSNTNVAAVSAAGVVTSGVNGSASVQVSVAGVAPANVPVVVKTLTSIAMSPTSFTLIGAGKTRQMVVTGTYSDGSAAGDLSGVVFSTTNPAAGTVSAGGLVTSTGVGNAVIRATLGALAPADSELTVVAKQATGLEVAPASRTFTASGETVTLQVVVRYNDGSTAAPTAAPVFATRDALVATVSAAGVVTAAANGSTVIDVTAEGIATTVAIAVDIPPVVPPPVIDALDRPRAAEGDRFAIRGRNFAATPAGNQVFINGRQAEVVTARVDELAVVVPLDATSGPVNVIVNGQVSNSATLGIYARRAVSTTVTTTIPPTAGPITMTISDLVVREGDRVLLSSAPDILAPLGYAGTLSLSVDGGAFVQLALASTATDLTNEFDAGTHSVQLKLEGATVASKPIVLVVGPDATGAIAGERTALAVNHSVQIPVTFTNLTSLTNVPLPDGTVVAVSMRGGCSHRDRFGNCLSGSEGRIANGADSSAAPGDPRVRNFVVQGGRIDVIYDALGVEVSVNEESVAYVKVLALNASGGFASANALAFTPVRLTSLDTAHAPRSQPAVIADGLQKIVNIDLQDFRDSAGVAVPDVKIAVSTLGSCSHRDRFGNCLSSTGGDIANGDPSLELGDARLRVFTINTDRVNVQYQPGGVVIPVDTVGTALVQVLPARPNGTRIGSRSFSETPITLSSARAEQAQVVVSPPSVLADNGDNRVTIVVSGITDVSGNPVPDGTRISVSTLGSCSFRDKFGNCVNSAGGVIKNGVASPDLGDDRVRVFQVANGQIEVIYSAEPVALSTPQTATARITFVPARSPDGGRIGSYAFAIADVTLASMGSATTVASPPSVIADGTPKTSIITVTNIRDEAGNLVPDGAVVVATTLGSCSHRDRSGDCINSVGGSIINGEASPEVGDNRMKVFTVMNGQIEVHYDPLGVLVGVPDVEIARIQLLPGRPGPVSRGTRVGSRAFAVVPVTLTSPVANAANVTVVPASTYADGGTRQSVVTVTNITDAQGRPAPDGTKVVVTTLGSCTHRDVAGNCISGTGGTIDSGTPSPEVGDNRMRVHTVVNGTVQAIYNSSPNAYATGDSGIGNVQFLPATPTGTRVGNRAFALAPVTVVGADSAVITGPGSVSSSSTSTYVVTNMVDLAGVPLPDGAKVAVSTLGSCTHRDRNGSCINGAGGNILGGDASPEFGDARMRVFTVQGGSITFSFQPTATGTAVVQVLPARPGGSRINIYAFAVKSVSVTP